MKLVLWVRLSISLVAHALLDISLTGIRVATLVLSALMVKEQRTITALGTRRMVKLGMRESALIG